MFVAIFAFFAAIGMVLASMNSPRIAFLGLGIMGTGMAGRLSGAGYPLTVYNRSRGKAEAIAGAKIADTPRAAVAGAEIVIAMVADDAASRAMWLGDKGALAGMAKGTLGVECSTLTVDWVKELAAAAAALGCELVDAPVTGSKGAAANGELNFLVGGSAAGFEKLRPVLTPMSRSVTHLGPTGSGALIKLINNFACGVQIAALAEALAWIERAGLDRGKALGVLTEGAPGSPLVKAVAARMTAADYTPNFKLELMAKDLRYALQQFGADAKHGLATAAAALEEFQRALDAGHAEKDMAAVIEPLRRSARSR